MNILRISEPQNWKNLKAMSLKQKLLGLTNKDCISFIHNK